MKAYDNRVCSCVSVRVSASQIMGRTSSTLADSSALFSAAFCLFRHRGFVSTKQRVVPPVAIVLNGESRISSLFRIRTSVLQDGLVETLLLLAEMDVTSVHEMRSPP